MARKRSPSEALVQQTKVAVGTMAGREPRRHIAMITCMDARLDPLTFREFALGDIHVIRNAGGLVTADAIRSLVISQRRLATTEVMVVMHTDCGMLNLDEQALLDEIHGDAGSVPQFGLGSFPALEDAVRRGVAAVAANPWLPHRDRVRGFVWNVSSLRLHPVSDA